jgi:hypothetical protein
MGENPTRWFVWFVWVVWFVGSSLKGGAVGTGGEPNGFPDADGTGAGPNGFPDAGEAGPNGFPDADEAGPNGFPDVLAASVCSFRISYLKLVF